MYLFTIFDYRKPPAVTPIHVFFKNIDLTSHVMFWVLIYLNPMFVKKCGTISNRTYIISRFSTNVDPLWEPLLNEFLKIH